MKTTQRNDVIICIHIDGYQHQVAQICFAIILAGTTAVHWPSGNGSFEGMAVGIIIDKLGIQTMLVAKPPGGEFFSIVIVALQQEHVEKFASKSNF